MINNDKVRNVRVPFKPIEGLATGATLGKIRLKNIYTSWNGESVADIKAKHDTNPYLVRIGTPNTDERLRSDNIYFISHYLAYNPITQDLENRDIISRRVMDKFYVGQSTLEGEYSECDMIVNGSAVLEDLYLYKHENLKDKSVSSVIAKLLDRVDQLTKEVAQLKAKVKTQPIYTKDSL